MSTRRTMWAFNIFFSERNEAFKGKNTYGFFFETKTSLNKTRLVLGLGKWFLFTCVIFRLCLEQKRPIGGAILGRGTATERVIGGEKV